MRRRVGLEACPRASRRSFAGSPRAFAGSLAQTPRALDFDANESRWIEEAVLDGHSDWVRDIAWAPSIGIDKSVIASCSQVINHDFG